MNNWNALLEDQIFILPINSIMRIGVGMKTSVVDVTGILGTGDGTGDITRNGHLEVGGRH